MARVSTQHPSWNPEGIFLTTRDDVNFWKYSFVGISFPLPLASQSLHPSLLQPPPCQPLAGPGGWRWVH